MPQGDKSKHYYFRDDPVDDPARAATQWDIYISLGEIDSCKKRGWTNKVDTYLISQRL